MKSWILALAAVMTAVLLVGQLGVAQAETVVDLELVLAADVSGSLDTNDFNLQRDGYAAAFRSSAVLNALASGRDLAVTLVYWSEGQSIAVNWMHVYDATTAEAFAAAVESAVRPGGIGIGTYMADGINFASGLFATNDFSANRLVIDISGDGADSENGVNAVDPEVQAARDGFLSGGQESRTINALWIDDRDFFGDDPADLIKALPYGQTNVIGGPSNFQSLVQDFDSFSGAITTKIGREVTGVVPEPTTFAIFTVIGGLGFVAARRRKRAA